MFFSIFYTKIFFSLPLKFIVAFKFGLNIIIFRESITACNSVSRILKICFALAIFQKLLWILSRAHEMGLNIFNIYSQFRLIDTFITLARISLPISIRCSPHIFINITEFFIKDSKEAHKVFHLTSYAINNAVSLAHVFMTLLNDDFEIFNYLKNMLSGTFKVCF